MLATNDDDLYQQILTLSNHGRARNQSKQFWPDMVGYKYKMSNIQAALGVAQMTRIEELIARKQNILHAYRRHLEGISEIALNHEPQHTLVGAWMPTAVFSEASGVTRERLQIAFKEQNIDARVFFYPLTDLPMFEGQKCWQARPISWASSIASRAMNLPSYHDISADDIERVCQVLKRLLGKA